MKTQKNKAITLVALVITMVVLIILAGLSINMLFGENGIITKAKLGKTKFLGEDAREVVEQRVAALKQESAQKGVDTTLYDFWFMYNSEFLEDGTTENKNFKDDMAIYLFTDELSAKFKPATKKASRPADSIANCEASYNKNTEYKTSIVVYKDYVTAVDKDVVVSLNSMEIDSDSDVQTFLESANANNGGTMNASLKQAAIEQGLNITLKESSQNISNSTYFSSLTPYIKNIIPSYTWSDYYASYAFDDKWDNSSKVWSATYGSGNINQYLVCEFRSLVCITSLKMKCGTINNEHVKGFSLYGSNDGNNYTKIYTGESYDDDEFHDFEFVNSTYYRYIKLQIDSAYHSNVAFYELIYGGSISN